MIGLLIVDDHPVVRDGLRGMFAGDDRFAVLGEAGNGREALAVASSVSPDVVLMDLRMPRWTGSPRSVRSVYRARPRGCWC
jgi:YesN/AraC family two-component response regulator